MFFEIFPIASMAWLVSPFGHTATKYYVHFLPWNDCSRRLRNFKIYLFHTRYYHIECLTLFRPSRDKHVNRISFTCKYNTKKVKFHTIFLKKKKHWRIRFPFVQCTRVISQHNTSLSWRFWPSCSKPRIFSLFIQLIDILISSWFESDANVCAQTHTRARAHV